MPSRRIGALWLAALLLASTVGCERTPARPVEPLVTELPLPSVTGWSRAGVPVPRNVLSLRLGPDHCGWESLAIITTGRQLGIPFTRADDERTFIRDPMGLVAERLVVAYGSSVAPPADAVYSGYTTGELELWLSPAAGDRAVFVVRESVWERWPRAREPLGCA